MHGGGPAESDRRPAGDAELAQVGAGQQQHRAGRDIWTGPRPVQYRVRHLPVRGVRRARVRTGRRPDGEQHAGGDPAADQQDYRRGQPPAPGQPGRPARIPAAADDVAVTPGHADILAPRT